MRGWRLIAPVAAALIAAVVVTILFTVPTLAEIEEAWNIVVVSQALSVARMTFIVAVAHALLLGLPAYFLMRSWNRVGVVACALGGFVIGAVPFGVLAWVGMFGLQSASTGGTPTVVNGTPTLAGWIEYATVVGIAGLYGLAGGLAFWAAVRLSGGQAGDPTGPGANSRRRSVASLAVLLPCAILVLPSVVWDRSCHNLFRDGRLSVGPQISADIKLPSDSWPELRQVFVDFGAAHALSFRNDEQVQGGDIAWRELNLCNDVGLNIDATDRPWLAKTKFPLAGRGVDFRVFQLEPGLDWKPLAHDLLNTIENKWPQQTTFRGPDGKVISIEEALKGRP